MLPHSPAAPSSVGVQPPALASRAPGPGASGGPRTVAVSELKTKKRHPKQSSGDAQRLSPCSGVLRCHSACRTGRRFSGREGERNRPCAEQQGFFIGVTGAADWTPCEGSPARVGTLRAFIPYILDPRSLLTAGFSPPFSRAAETSGGAGAQVSRQPPVAGNAGSAGPADPERIPRARRPRLVSLCRHVNS